MCFFIIPTIIETGLCRLGRGFFWSWLSAMTIINGCMVNNYAPELSKFDNYVSKWQKFGSFLFHLPLFFLPSFLAKNQHNLKVDQVLRVTISKQETTISNFLYILVCPPLFFHLSSPLNPNTWSCVCIYVCVCVCVFFPSFQCTSKERDWRREISILMFKGDILFWVFEFNFVESTSDVCIESLFSWKYQ